MEPLFQYDLPIEQDPIRLVIERRVPWVVHGESFSQQSFGTGPWPDQGWKLHVSATPLSAVEVLEAACDVLLAEGARFKVVNSISLLTTLNSGVFGISQIGKFITVYPSGDAQAVRLAVDLDAATRGRRGPRVPTDRALRPDSLVHYRYGSMIRRPESQVAGHDGEGMYDLLDPAGRLADDVRLDYYRAPSQIEDPFEAAGVRVAPPPRGRLLNGRYFISDAVGQSRRGGVFRAVDISATPARLCLLKETWHDVGLDPFGRDARDWAANEEYILTRYAGDPMLPRFYDRFEVDGDRYIAIEYVEGTSFDKVLAEEHDLQEGIDPAELIEIGLTTGAALERLHELGLVFRDLKPANLIKTPEGGYRLIDFGIAYEYLEDSGPPLSIGTPPFYSREQYEGAAPSPDDDVFAWGALLCHLAGGDASFADMPKGKDFLQPFPRRPIAEIRPGFPPRIAEVIDRAVAWKRADRYPTMREAREALADAARRLDATGVEPPGGFSSDQSGQDALITTTSAPSRTEPEEALSLAREVGDALCAEAEERDGGLCWKRRFEWTERTEYGPDLYGGAAGVALFLAELAQRTGEERYAEAARGAARWLAGPTWGRGRAQHGLHHGEAGVAYFFLRLAELLDSPGYVAAAELRLRRLRGAESLTVDVIYGTAGTLLGLLALHAVTGDSETLAEARAIGDHLVGTALTGPPEGDGCYWEVNAAVPGGPVLPFLGLLHGAAGIGLALAHLGAATGEASYLDTAKATAEMLLAHSTAAPPDPALDVGGNGEASLTWQRYLGDPAAGLQAHCHGAGGIGQFFLWLDALVPDPRYREAAIGAALTLAVPPASATRSGICHGLSGTGHHMVDCYQALGDPRWLEFARQCGGNLQRFRVPERPGVYAMHGQEETSPDLLVGYAGVGSLLLRLVDAASAPDLILGSLNKSLNERSRKCQMNH